MKDPAHHIAKINRQVIRSVHNQMEEGLILPSTPAPKRPERQLKKQAKAAVRKERTERTPTHLTEAERNWRMKHRVPVFDRLNNAKPKSTKKTSKKTPRI